MKWLGQKNIIRKVIKGILKQETTQRIQPQAPGSSVSPSHSHPHASTDPSKVSEFGEAPRVRLQFSGIEICMFAGEEGLLP